MNLFQGGELDNLQVMALLQDIYTEYGYDFRNYAFPSLKRRLQHFMIMNKLSTLNHLRKVIFDNDECFDDFLLNLSVLVTSMFRDPGFFCALRNKVIPLLDTYPIIRVWIAGCSTGEEAYSIAILLLEEGLFDRSIIYATDMNLKAINMAKQGIYSLPLIQNYTNDYIQSGGGQNFSNYYKVHEGKAEMLESIKRNIHFMRHNLVTDSVFNEFNLILCRNVLIYFNQTLQKHTHRLLYKSLAPFCFLALGEKESMLFTPYVDNYMTIDEQEKIYKKIK